jgi:hypothetical protein
MPDYTITTDARHERALIAAVARHNADNGTTLTIAEYVQTKTRDYLEALVRGYEERVKNQMAENFTKLTPEQQAAILAQLGIVT